MKRLALFLFIPLVLVPVPLSWFSVQGPWADPLLSRFLSSKFNAAIQCKKTRLVHWSKIYFDAMTVENTLSTGPGYFNFKPSETDIRFSEITVAGRFKHPASFLTEWVRFPLKIAEVRGALIEKKESRTVHITHFLSEQAVVKGGLKTEGGRMTKAHFLVLAPGEALGKLPNEIASRMIVRGGGWKGFRILFREELLTVVGANGPVFQAQWKSGV